MYYLDILMSIVLRSESGAEEPDPAPATPPDSGSLLAAEDLFI